MNAMEDTLTLTPEAIAKVAYFMKEQGVLNKALRIYVEGGGCSGFRYGFSFDDKQEDDHEFSFTPPIDVYVKVVIDPMSWPYLKGSVVDYQETMAGSGFIVSNPNSTTKCGCGESFGV